MCVCVLGVGLSCMHWFECVWVLCVCVHACICGWVTDTYQQVTMCLSMCVWILVHTVCIGVSAGGYYVYACMLVCLNDRPMTTGQHVFVYV